MNSAIKLHAAVWISLFINITLNLLTIDEYSQYFDIEVIIAFIVIPWLVGIFCAIAFTMTQKKWQLIVLIISFIPFIPIGFLGIWGVSKTMSALNKKMAGID
ncbi:ABC transporter permease [Rodentibacter caecimuris]|uniref:ABC transporter permease n=1 Tax=Rodentibacter caecimuris TaxID=1796644 RepID=A0A1V3KQX6_9PAST|nr:ABC transporter permease [Rodentibacter heylii]OOF79740.1 ABC transporter permease [Rodentibacter heylii]